MILMATDSESPLLMMESMVVMVVVMKMMHNVTENRKPFPLITRMITGQSAITHVACDHIVICNTIYNIQYKYMTNSELESVDFMRSRILIVGI